MDARRKMLEQHLVTINALLRGGISRGAGGAVSANDKVGSSLKSQWETQRNLLKRVLSEAGDPVDTIMEWRERTDGFRDKFPERDGWTDRDGIEWRVEDVLDAIDKLLEQVEAWEESADELYEEYDDET